MDLRASLREQFIKFFERNGHLELKHDSVIPKQDPTLLFINSGMASMKSYFTGLVEPPSKCIVTCQPCLRVGGKHNDLDEVGRTKRHHTFFQMLGNFSFGGYQKQEAISMAWEFITEVLNLPKERLWVTVYPQDKESAQAWKAIGVHTTRILPVAENVWLAGDSGPRGYCTEVFYDFGEQFSGHRPDAGDTGERYVEIWNLVFMDHQIVKGKKIPLDTFCIDTGMGLERTEAVLRNSNDSFDSVVMSQLTDYSGKDLSGKILADHARAAIFLIADGVQPGPTGRGYVLRRILRRALRYQMSGTGRIKLSEVAAMAVDLMKDEYPRLAGAKTNAISLIELEKQQFESGWRSGSKLLKAEISKIGNGGLLSGKTAFKLYDTYGFPVDLAECMCREANVRIDAKEFNSEMAQQQSRSKALGKRIEYESIDTLPDTEFIGYDSYECESKVLALFDCHGNRTRSVNNGGWVVLDRTPFYAEAGGQEADTGLIDNVQVLDVIKIGEVWLHKIEGAFSATDGAVVRCAIDKGRRLDLRVHHSSTHLLVAAIRKLLNVNVTCGSAVGADRLRLDFACEEAIDDTTCRKIEQTVNQWIADDIKCSVKYMSFKDAVDMGAQVLPGNQYPAHVRVIDFDATDIQLCCGTHVRSTREIIALQVLERKAVGAGVKRITCKAGRALIRHLQQQCAMGVSKQKTGVENRTEVAWEEYTNSDMRFVYGNTTAENQTALRLLDQKMRQSNAQLGILLASNKGKNALLCKSCVKSLNAYNIASKCIQRGDKGGGKAHFAQFSVSKLDSAWINEFIKQNNLSKQQ